MKPEKQRKVIGSFPGIGGAATACISPLIDSWSMLGAGNLVKEPRRADVGGRPTTGPPPHSPGRTVEGGGEHELSPAFT